MTGPLAFEPIYQARVWGGHGLTAVFDRDIRADAKIGESWELVDRAQEQSVVARGPHRGATLRALIEQRPEAIMGPAWDPHARFPILVKWLDCQERLSLQVHPPAAVAASLGGEPKTENWFIARATPGASLIVGLRRGVTRGDFERALATDALEALVHRFPVEAGDSMFVPSGRIHAIDAGNLILEIQQNSDTTYRVYDWGRMGDDGRPRPLHVSESLQCIDFGDIEPDVLRPPPGGDVTLAECDQFRIRRCERMAGAGIPLDDAAEPRIVSIVRGSADVETAAGSTSHGAGDNVLLPADTPCSLRAGSDTTVLITDRFARAIA